MEAPQFTARLGIVRGDVCDLGSASGRGRAAADYFSVDHDRSGRVRDASLSAGLSHVPDERTGSGVKRNHVRVAREMKDLVAVDRDIARATDLRYRDRLLLRCILTFCTGCTCGGGFVAIFPDQIAGARIQRLDDVSRRLQVKHAVVSQRRAVLPTRRHHPRPGKFQVADVRARDLIQGTEGPRVVRTPVHQPIAVCRPLERLRCDWREALHLLCRDPTSSSPWASTSGQLKSAERQGPARCACRLVGEAIRRCAGAVRSLRRTDSRESELATVPGPASKVGSS